VGLRLSKTAAPDDASSRILSNLFIEEPVFDRGGSFMEVSAPDGEHICVPPAHPVAAPGFPRRTTQHHSATAGRSPGRIRHSKTLAWLYTTMALPLVPAWNRRHSSTTAWMSYQHSSMHRASSYNAKGAFSRSRISFHTAVQPLPGQVKGRITTFTAAPAASKGRISQRSRPQASTIPEQKTLDRPRLGFFGVMTTD